jgi:hypothetical protein
MAQERAGVAKMLPLAGGGVAPAVAGMGVYPATAILAPNCHRKISPDAQPAHERASRGTHQSEHRPH